MDLSRAEFATDTFDPVAESLTLNALDLFYGRVAVPTYTLGTEAHISCPNYATPQVGARVVVLSVSAQLRSRDHLFQC